MIPASTELILYGIACLGVSGLIGYRLSPRDANAESAWTRTEGRATAVALMVVVAFVVGVGFLARGILV